MFGNRKLKELERKVERLEFIQSYPPKYKIGDKPSKDHIITYSAAEQDYLHTTYGQAVPCGFKWVYKVTNIKTGVITRL